MKIIKFKYFKESALPTTHLKNEQYFKDYFMDLIDEGYKLKITINYIRKYNKEVDESEHRGEYDFDYGSRSNYPRKGYCPIYAIELKIPDQENNGLDSSKHISNYINIISIFNNGFNNLSHDSELIVFGEVEISHREFPRFALTLIENISPPDEELPDELFYEFIKKIKDSCIYNYRDISTIKQDDEKKSLTLTIDGTRQQVNVILRAIDKLKIKRDWRNSNEFDIKELNNKKPYLIEISNIKEVGPIKRSYTLGKNED